MPKPHKSHLKFLQQQYAFLDITIEQAELVDYYESEHTNIGALSIWEEHAYYISAFSNFLTAEQQEVFKKYMDERLAEDEKALVDQDKKEEKSVLYYNELIKYCEQELLPKLFSDPKLARFVRPFPSEDEQPKMNLLKAEYLNFLRKKRSNLLSNHCRYNLSFAPLQLERIRLELKLSHIWPSYISFKNSMDSPTQAVHEFLVKRLPSTWNDAESMLKKSLGDFNLFQLELMKKYHSVPNTFNIEQQEWSSEEREGILMVLALVDEKKYGC